MSLGVFAASVLGVSPESLNSGHFSGQKTPEMEISSQESPKIFSGRSFSKVRKVPEPENGRLVVKCEEKNWRIVVKRHYFGRGVVLSPESVGLGEDGAPGDCSPLKDFITSTEMVLSARLQDCGSESRVRSHIGSTSRVFLRIGLNKISRILGRIRPDGVLFQSSESVLTVAEVEPNVVFCFRM